MMLSLGMNIWRSLRASQSGAVTLETAILLPVLMTLSIGGFEVSMIVARQSELQGAAAEAAAIVRASVPETEEQRTAIRDVVATSAGVASNKVSVVEVFRCENGDSYVTSAASCAEGTPASTYVQITIADVHKPLWTTFGIGNPLAFNVSRTILIG